MAIDNRRDTPGRSYPRTSDPTTWLVAAAVALAVIAFLVWGLGSGTDRAADTNSGPSVQTLPTTPAPPSDPVAPPPTP